MNMHDPEKVTNVYEYGRTGIYGLAYLLTKKVEKDLLYISVVSSRLLHPVLSLLKTLLRALRIH